MTFLLFGWGHTSKRKEDETPIEICEHCHADYLYLTKITSWFTIFFIPIIPYSSKFYFLCSNCEYGFEIDKDEVDKVIEKLEKFKNKKVKKSKK